MILAFVTAVASPGGGDLPVNADRSAHGVVPMPHAQGSHPPLVSIVLPAFVTGEHEARTLDETLASLDAQSCSDVEVIVVDDGSPVEVARLVARHPRTFTVRQPNAGPAVARNTGIDVSRGSTFLFIDVGDQLLPSTIERGLAVLDARPEAAFVAGACESLDAPEREARTGAPPLAQPHLYLPLLGGDWFVASPAIALFRRAIVEALGGFRDPWGADVLDFYLRAAYRAEGHTVSTAFARAGRTAQRGPRDAERLLHSLRAVYDRQWSLVRGCAEAEAAHARGLRALGDRYVPRVVERTDDMRSASSLSAALVAADAAALEAPVSIAAALRGI